MENLIQPSLPHGSSVKLLSAEGWQVADAPLKAEYEILIPNFATRTGKRLVVPMDIFHTTARSSLTSASRVNPVYFDYPFESYEEITLDLPLGFELESLPSPQSIQREAGQYEFMGEVRGDTIHLQRSFKQSGYYFPVASYAALRSFYNLVRASDEQQITLSSVRSSDEQ